MKYPNQGVLRPGRFHSTASAADLAAFEERLRPPELERRLLRHLVRYRSGHVPAEEYLGDGALIRALGVPWVTAQRAVGSLARKLGPRAGEASARLPPWRPTFGELTPAP